MLDTYVITRLSLWAEWRIRRKDGGLGYPRKSAFVRETSSGFWTPDMDSGCMDVDVAVCGLLPERRDVIMQCYTQLGTKSTKASRCGCCVRTYDARLEMAHKDVLGFLNDLAAGIEVKPYVQTSARVG